MQQPRPETAIGNPGLALEFPNPELQGRGRLSNRKPLEVPHKSIPEIPAINGGGKTGRNKGIADTVKDNRWRKQPVRQPNQAIPRRPRDFAKVKGAGRKGGSAEGARKLSEVKALCQIQLNHEKGRVDLRPSYSSSVLTPASLEFLKYVILIARSGQPKRG